MQQGKASQTRQRFLFHGFIRLWLRNSGLRPSNSLATTANFISWNNVIAADGLLMSSSVCIMPRQQSETILSQADAAWISVALPEGREGKKQTPHFNQASLSEPQASKLRANGTLRGHAPKRSRRLMKAAPLTRINLYFIFIIIYRCAKSPIVLFYY